MNKHSTGRNKNYEAQKLLKDYKKVESSNIHSIMYSPDTKDLFIVFLNGGHYKYNPVSNKLAKEFIAAESKGNFFFKNIKGNKDITYEKVK